MKSSELRDLVLKHLEEKNASNISVIEPKMGYFADYVILANGRSVKNISAIAWHIAQHIKHNTNLPVFIEGMDVSQWVLIDIQNIVVHLFYPSERERLKIEDMFAA